MTTPVRHVASVIVPSIQRCSAGTSRSAANGFVITRTSTSAHSDSDATHAAPGADESGSEAARRITDERARIQASTIANTVATSEQTAFVSSATERGSSGGGGASRPTPTSTSSSASASPSTNGSSADASHTSHGNTG